MYRGKSSCSKGGIMKSINIDFTSFSNMVMKYEVSAKKIAEVLGEKMKKMSQYVEIKEKGKWNSTVKIKDNLHKYLKSYVNKENNMAGIFNWMLRNIPITESDFVEVPENEKKKGCKIPTEDKYIKEISENVLKKVNMNKESVLTARKELGV